MSLQRQIYLRNAGLIRESVEQIDEAYRLKLTKTTHPKDVTDDEDNPVKATVKHYDIHQGDKKVGTIKHHYDEYDGHSYSANLHGKNVPYERHNGTEQGAKAFIDGVTKTKWHSKNIKEEIEQIDELSKNTLGSYVGKAYKDQGKRMGSAGALIGAHAVKTGKAPTNKQIQKMVGKDEVRKDKNRDAGVERAISRLSKEEIEQFDDTPIEEALSRLTEEEVVQLKKLLKKVF